MIDAVLRVFVKVKVGIEWYEVSFFFHDARTREVMKSGTGAVVICIISYDTRIQRCSQCLENQLPLLVCCTEIEFATERTINIPELFRNIP